MKIGKLRREKGLTRTELESLAGLKPRALEGYENGIRRQNGMALETAIKVADVLGVHPRNLLDEE